MNFLKTIAAVSAIAVSSFSVNAEQISVGGITWDSSYTAGVSLFSDFFAGADYSQTLTASGDLSGDGVVGFVNGTDDDIFCVVAGCTLSYSFDGFNVNSSNVVTTTAGTLDFTVTDSLGNDSLWLSLAASGPAIYASNIDTSSNETTTFTVLLDVLEVAGTAWKNFDTDTLNGSDVILIGSNTDGAQLDTDGAIFKSNSVPAPTTLAIFGLGLLGLAAARRKA